MKIISVVGARPNYMKVAPLQRELARRGHASLLVHTGQHYDERMSEIFFRQLRMPEPDVHLGVGSGNHAHQTAAIMTGFDDVVSREDPGLVVVAGDVNSTLACALVAAKRLIPVAHVEAGLRSGDMTMPEEINRILTDHISSFLFVTEESGVRNLAREGLSGSAIHVVGNLMIDTLVEAREKARGSAILDRLGIERGAYLLMTMHRPANVDDGDDLAALVEVIARACERLPVVLPLHPRTRQRIDEEGLRDRLESLPGLKLLEPLGYVEFLRLMEDAALVLTDSGGVQEETTFLGVRCLTLRDSTERPVTIELGTNELVPLIPDTVIERISAALEGPAPLHRVPPLWDGRAAERVVDVLEREGPLSGQSARRA